ncbi:MAG: sugar phosphorylase, partial [Chloroflexaceae bacterium]
FHPNAPQRVIEAHPAVFALERRTPEGDATVLCLHNVSAVHQRVPAPGAGGARDLIGGARYAAGTDVIELAPYQVAWLRLE